MGSKAPDPSPKHIVSVSIPADVMNGRRDWTQAEKAQQQDAIFEAGRKAGEASAQALLEKLKVPPTPAPPPKRGRLKEVLATMFAREGFPRPAARPKSPNPSPRPEDDPLRVTVAHGRLTISVGIDTLAFAFEHSRFAQPYENGRGFRQAFTVKDAMEFAKDVRGVLTAEQEDGTTPLHILLDKAMQDAVEDGSIAVEDADGPAKE